MAIAGNIMAATSDHTTTEPLGKSVSPPHNKNIHRVRVNQPGMHPHSFSSRMQKIVHKTLLLKPTRLALSLVGVYSIVSIASFSLSKHNIWQEGYNAVLKALSSNEFLLSNASATNKSLRPNQLMRIKNSTRSRVFWCHWRPHMMKPKNILQKEFGYVDEVNPSEGDDWDLIFGGYPNCGSVKFDFEMKTGLNKYLNDQGWDKLSPHQVWFPCMGCKASYCNKRDLCYLIKKVDPNYCFSLPDDRDRLIKLMESAKNSQTQQLWVLKQDHPSKHLHVSAGVRFIESVSELPNEQDQTSGEYLVQPLVQHKMGIGGGYRNRRHELKMFISVTSTTPLRAYAYNKIVGKFANHEINSTNPLEPCSVDTHGLDYEKKLGCHINETYSSVRSIDQFSENLSLTDSEKSIFISKTNNLIAKILMLSQPEIQNHTINRGITASGAACFSFLRADFAMNDAMEPYIYEINEFPFANQKGYFGSVQDKAYRDLFSMIGLDKPPLVGSERGKYELEHLGGWTPLVVDDVIAV
jgi:hypothetical protein